MSQISILGFTPVSSLTPSEVHWTIFISPHPPSLQIPKSRSRFFQPKTSLKDPEPQSILFDMHKHQLRQQPFPIPATQGPSKSSADTGSDSSNTPEPASETRQHSSSSETAPSTTDVTAIDSETSSTTLNAQSRQPLELTLRISASILPQPPQKLIPKLSHKLYSTPTYGSETDWLHSALCTMHNGLLEPGFDVDKFVEYANEAARDYRMYEPDAQPATDEEAAANAKPVLDLDFVAHITSNVQAKDSLSQQHGQFHAPTQLPTPPGSPKMVHVQQELHQKKHRRWLGFHI